MELSYDPVKFGGYLHCGIVNGFRLSRDMKGLCDFMDCMFLEDCKIKGTYYFMGPSSSRYVTILPSLVTLGTVIVEI